MWTLPPRLTTLWATSPGSAPAPAMIPMRLGRPVHGPPQLSAPFFGVHSERLPPSRMNARISCTVAWPANSSATSSMRSTERAFVGKQQPVGAAQVVDVVAREAAPLQADDVEAGQVRAIAERHAVGDEIVLEPRHAADEGVRADARELDDRRAAADDGEVADGAMAGQHDVVGEDDAVADAAVVADVAVGEERAAVADRRDQAAAVGAGVHA